MAGQNILGVRQRPPGIVVADAVIGDLKPGIFLQFVDEALVAVVQRLRAVM